MMSEAFTSGLLDNLLTIKVSISLPVYGENRKYDKIPIKCLALNKLLMTMVISQRF